MCCLLSITLASYITKYLVSTHTHTHISVRTCVCRPKTPVHIIYSKNFNIIEHNHKGKQTFLHTLKQKSAKCTHTLSHVILPQGSDSSESFTCVLCTDTRQQNLDYVQHRQTNSALFDQNKAFALKYSNIPWVACEHATPPGFSHKLHFIYRLTGLGEHRNDHVPMYLQVF